MKNIILLLTLSFFLGNSSYSQISVDEIVDSYFEITGGKANWEKLEGVKLDGISNTQGMEIPVEILQLKSGKQYVKISLQGKEMMQGVIKQKRDGRIDSIAATIILQRWLNS